MDDADNLKLYGSIPLISEGIDFIEANKDIIRHQEWKKSDEEERNNVYQVFNEQLKQNPLLTTFLNKFKQFVIYGKKDKEEDISSEPHFYKHIIFIDDEKICYVGLFRYKQNNGITINDVIGLGGIDYHINKYGVATGIIQIDLLYCPHDILSGERKKELIYRELYACVREVYHAHTFHLKTHDLLLKLVCGKNYEDAANKICIQYSRKILIRHKVLGEFNLYKNEKMTMDYVLFAKGEMIYALRFIELADYDSLNHFNGAFKYALQSMDCIEKSVLSDYELDQNKKMLILTAAPILVAIILPYLPPFFTALWALLSEGFTTFVGAFK